MNDDFEIEEKIDIGDPAAVFNMDMQREAEDDGLQFFEPEPAVPDTEIKPRHGGRKPASA